MKNNTVKLIPTRKYHASPRLTHDFKRKLIGRVELCFVNRDFIELIEATVNKLPAKDKIACLHYFMKLAKQVLRRPDSDWLTANEDLYLEKMSELQDEQEHFEPVKWIEAELEYLLAAKGQETVEPDSQKFGDETKPAPIFDEELMPEKRVIEMTGMSKSKLLRLRSEGMPFRKIGKPIFYDMKEVRLWLKTQVA